MAAGMRLRVRNNSPPSRRWFWDNACNMCRTLVQGGMCWEEDQVEDDFTADDDNAGADGGGGGDGDGDGGESVESVEECCARAYRAPHVQASFSVW